MLRQEIVSRLDLDKSYAIRSSANVEDHENASFAGQFESVLEVKGIEAVLDAIKKVWESASNDRVDSYLQSQQMDPSDLRMAVILQEMVSPKISGVSFSRNPITGLDETVIEWIPGRGDALVQEGVTPNRWVNKWGKWTVRPAESSAVEAELLEQVADETREIAQVYGKPVDLEWVFDGKDLFWVQIRSIAAFQNVNIYSNRISREVLPGIIKPLVWSVNIPLVNGAWIEIFTELIGPNDLKAEDLSKSFYYRAYFNMGLIGRVLEALGLPKTTLELMMGLEGGDQRPRFRPSRQMLRHIPRLLSFAWTKARYGKKLERLIPEMKRELSAVAAPSETPSDPQETLRRIDDLFQLTQRCAYANILAPLLMALYNKLLERKLTKIGIDFDRLDVTQDLKELDQFDPNRHLSRLYKEYSELPSDVRSEIEERGWKGLESIPGADQLLHQITDFIERFGHLSDSGNDFSRKPWREDPELVLRLVTGFGDATGDGARIGWQNLPLSRWRRFRLDRLYRRARSFRYYREATGSLFTYGYGLFRNYFLILGEVLARNQTIGAQEDIFYLNLTEIRTLFRQADTQPTARELIRSRRDEIERCRDVDLPDIIYGDDPPPLEASGEDYLQLSGIPTSRGYFLGPTRVIEDSTEFDQMERGSVLVIPYSDVAWTPLFSKAGAVVSESGGILSHSSIVAREYGLPAVVSVTGACRKLVTGTIVSVDGYKGLVTIHEQKEAD